MVSLTESGLLLFYGARSLTLADRAGRVIAAARWQKSRLDLLDSGATVSADGRRVAFRLSDARAGARQGNAVLFVLSRGELQARAVYRHRLGPVGCGTWANMRWHGRQLLYSAPDGQVAIVDGASGRRLDLGQFAKALPRRVPTEQPLIAWRADGLR
jgi:hypothetical protein